MKNQKGFSLIEVLVAIVIIILSIWVFIILVTSFFPKSSTQSLSSGYNGVTETRCINGYQFVVGYRGNTQQVLNEKGGGIKCN